MVQVLWGCQFDTIIDVKLGDSDTDSYEYEPTAALLARWETIKKDKHIKHCHDQRKHFSPFVLSVEVMLGRETLVVLSQFSPVVVDKREEPILQVRGWLKG